MTKNQCEQIVGWLKDHEWSQSVDSILDDFQSFISKNGYLTKAQIELCVKFIGTQLAANEALRMISKPEGASDVF